MSQNTSSAVMQQRHSSQRKAPANLYELFPTPPWATRALCEWLQNRHGLDGLTVWEPAAGYGDMVRPLQEYFGKVTASDIYDHTGTTQQHDFIMPGEPLVQPDFVITNPPFKLAERFILRALPIAKQGVAVLVRSAFLEGGQRYRNLFRDNPPTVLQFVERVPMLVGRLSATTSTATAYCWLAWLHGSRGGSIECIPPCRKSLEREGDYA